MSRRRLPYEHNRYLQVRGFYYAARERSISRAADRLALSQPSVSLQIQALELALDTKLLERHGPRISLTRDGRALLELVRPLVEGFERLDDSFAEQRESLAHGSVSIAAGGSTLQYMLPAYIERFAREYPDIDLRLHNVTGKGGLALLRAGDVDFAVGPLLEPPPDIEFQPLVAYPALLITRLDHPLAQRQRVGLRDIARHPLILPPRDQSTFRMVEKVFRQRKLKYEVKLEVGGYEVIKTYVQLGLGISIVMGHCLQQEDQLHARPLSRFFPPRNYGLVLRRNSHLSPAAQRFVRILHSDYAAASRPALSVGGARRRLS
jgi:DNA-binding transcriptional LysR family regulator